MPKRLQTNADNQVPRQPWDRLPEETPRQYGQFRSFLDIQTDERTFEAGWQKWKAIHKPHINTPAPGYWRTTARKFEWTARADAYDAHQSRLIEEKLRNRMIKARMETADLGETLRKKAAQAARMLTTVTQQIGERDGREVWLVEQALSPADISRMASVGVELEQLALGGATSRTEHSGKLENPAASDVSLANAKAEINRRLQAMRTRYDDVQNRLGRMNDENTAPTTGPRLLPPSQPESAA